MADETWVVTMPKLGETVTEGTVGSWLKNVGDTVEFDDPLFEVSTDKVDSEIPSPYDGVILEILVQAGETVPVGTEVVRIGAPGSTPGAAAPVAPAETSAPAAQAETSSPAAGDQSAGQSGEAEGSGMVHDLTMPKLGETVTEGTVGSWLKNVGDTVEFDDPLFEVSTDKVDSEIPSPYDGVLLEILVPAGETVPVGTIVARIGEPGATPSSSGKVGPVQVTGAAAMPTSSVESGTATPNAEAGKNYSPIVRRLAAENGIDLTTLTGTGEGGRIRREDVQAAIESRPVRGAAPAPTKPSAPSAPAAAASAPAAATSAGARPSGEVPAVPGVADDRDEVKPLSKMRLAIAAGMVQSLQISPQVWTSVEVDYENIEIARSKHKDAYKKATGASLSYMTFVARVLPDLLLKYPAINSSIDVPNKTQTFHPYVNLGIAVDMNQQGLMVPVVKNADQLNLKGLGIQIKEIATATRAGKLSADAFKGSTFTITNVGPFQSYASAPIINQPNVAILCTEGVSRKPVAIGNSIAIHSVGILSLVYDHRAFDGSTASMFLFDLRNALQDRDWEDELGG